MKKFLIAFVKAIVSAILAADTFLFHHTGRRTPLLRFYHKWQGQQRQAQLNEDVAKRNARLERREQEIQAKAAIWQARHEATINHRKPSVVFLGRQAVA